ncbi:uncharacterized protein BDR25DRAFT_312924 [Lindgomyces ingoldianus]|uniref:Uncharacterized protein n=1 Tax=Lindgomyces ingoldianus TaxID=673940 RepID=A0ACB6R208_9PLEO|nr:uncharacterized protein BDR25DRAFT_312924 [Lindgomyces ingoldianus]KAF2472372.1 hypothetical protein BDR25DRAFT_312924 [Lindgomyces ingoldianus]
MSKSGSFPKPGDNKAFRAQFSITQLEDFAHLFIGPLSDILLICLDATIHEIEPREISELGITLVDSRDIKTSAEISYAKIIATTMVPMHFRIREYGHLRNRRYGHHNPENFRFGTTKWVTKTQGPNILKEILGQKANPSSPNPKAPLRPIVVLGHAIHDTIRKLHWKYSINIEVMDHVVGILDTQDLARETGRSGASNISLRKLAGVMGMDISCASNSGDSAACAMLCAGIMVQDAVPEPDRDCFSKPRVLAENEAQVWETVSLDYDPLDSKNFNVEVSEEVEDENENVDEEASNHSTGYRLRGRSPTMHILVHTKVEDLIPVDPALVPSPQSRRANFELCKAAELQGQQKPAPRWGVAVYCLRCNRINDHVEGECDIKMNKVTCAKCRAHRLPVRVVTTHHTLRCMRFLGK